MKVGFLIINYNDYETTSKLISNIRSYNIIDKIVVVDNNSTDNSYTKLKRIKLNNLDVIKNKANKGYGSGINFGSKYLEKVLGDCYIIVSNPDVVIYNEQDIEKLIDTFDDSTAIVAPIIKEHEGLNRGWKIPTPFQDCAMNLLYIHRYLRKKMIFYPDEVYKNNIINVEAVSGCFFVTKSNSLRNVGYFDENIFLYYEENVIGKKFKNVNLNTKLNTKVEVFHNHSVTIDKNINHIKKYKELKKSQMYFHKNYNKANLLEISLLLITNKLSLIILYIASASNNLKNK